MLGGLQSLIKLVNLDYKQSVYSQFMNCFYKQYSIMIFYSAILSACATSAVFADASVTLSPWKMHFGNGVEITDGWQSSPYDAKVTDDCPEKHGDECYYKWAVISLPDSLKWRDPPNVNTIGMKRDSLLCENDPICFGYVDYTYFQSFLRIPENCTIDKFTIAFDGMDDGSRVSVNGDIVADSYVYLGGQGTTDLSAIVKSGQENRIVITQVDDCCKENNLIKAVVTLESSCETVTCSSEPNICGSPGWIRAPDFDDIICAKGICTVEVL